MYEWFMTMFSRCLNLSLVSRVWDLYFLDGIFVLYQTSIGNNFYLTNVAILRVLEKSLLEQEFEGIMQVLKNVTEYVTDEEQFVGFIYDVTFPKWVYDEIPQLESEF